MKTEFTGFRDWEYLEEMRALSGFNQEAIDNSWDRDAQPALIRSLENALDDFAVAAAKAEPVITEEANKDDAPAFGNDLKIGSVVWSRMKEVLPTYYKNDVRPMLVTGLWRDGDDIKKIELMNFTTREKYQGYPQTFEIHTPENLKAFQTERSNYLLTDKIYIFDNSKAIFPMDRNGEIKIIDQSMWPEILVRRAYAIMLSGFNNFQGSYDLSLQREGFEFRGIPAYSVLGNEFTPEVMTDRFASKATDILPQAAVDMIAEFSVAYSLEAGKDLNFFSFPPVKDWPFEMERVEFPDWRKVAGGRFVSAPSPELS
jgi:hypothetical protein